MNEYEIRFTLANISNKIKLKLLQMYNNEENIYNNIDNIINKSEINKIFIKRFKYKNFIICYSK